MNRYLKAFLSAGGVGVLAIAFWLLGWGFFSGLGVGLIVWLISAVLGKLQKGDGGAA